jgi:hypothetical protein
LLICCQYKKQSLEIPGFVFRVLALGLQPGQDTVYCQYPFVFGFCELKIESAFGFYRHGYSPFVLFL